MNLGRQMECIHKITRFQAHRNCYKLASICEKQCQELHKNVNEEILVLPLEAVNDQFKALSKLIKLQLDQHSSKLSQIYEEVINTMKKKQEESVNLLKKQIFEQLMKGISFDKHLFTKLQNRRYQRLKCNELMDLMDESNTQQKIKKTALNKIYQKYQIQSHKFKQSLFSGKLIQNVISNQQKETVSQKQIKNDKPILNQELITKPVTNAELHNEVIIKQQKIKINGYRKLIEQGQKNIKDLSAQLQKQKYNYKVLNVEKKNIEREFSKLKALGSTHHNKLSLKTWNILQVITKKIKKQPKLLQIQHISEENNVIVQQVQNPVVYKHIQIQNQNMINLQNISNQDNQKGKNTLNVQNNIQLEQLNNQNQAFKLGAENDNNRNQTNKDCPIIQQLQTIQNQANQLNTDPQETPNFNQPLNGHPPAKLLKTTEHENAMNQEDDEQDFFTYLRNKKFF